MGKRKIYKFVFIVSKCNKGIIRQINKIAYTKEVRRHGVKMIGKGIKLF
jgi:hypothetical protein